MKRNSTLFVLYSAISILVAFIAISVQYAPIFTLNILFVFTIIICYVMTEDWTTHDAMEFENRFWTLTAGMLARACVFCSDSPFFISDERNGFAWLIVFFAAYGAHLYDRHLRRLVLSRVPKIPRVKSSTYDLSSRVNARTKLAELRKLQDMLDNKYISSTFQNMFNLGKVLHIENQILEIFQGADKDELNLILSTAELGHIFYKVKDHKFVQQFHRTKLLEILAVERLHELNVTARTMLLDAFQKMKLTAHPKADSYVRNIITNTKGDSLSELKSLSDCKGDINSFHKLVYRDIESADEKSAILKHIKKQAMVQEAYNTMGSRTGKQRSKLAWRKVMSDVDDTLTCSGGVWPAGIDTRYPRKALYPGVLAFYRELDLGSSGEDSWDALTRVGNLVFLSARPHLYKEVSEAHNYAKFRDLQEKRNLYTSPTLLTGSLSTGTNFIVGGSPEPLAVKKFENMTEYLKVYPEFSCILVGDNGQGDVRAAEMIQDDEEYRKNLTRTYIHLVQPLYLTHTLHNQTKQISTSDSNICYFTNYIEAAIDAYKNKLIKLHGLRRIMEETVNDFRLIPKDAWASTQDSGFSIPPGTQQLTDDSCRASGRDKSSSSYSSGNFSRRRGLVSAFSPELKYDARMRELNLSLYQANKILVTNSLLDVKLMRFKCRFANGSLVKTFMGTGVVTRFRDCDGIYEVLLQWDKTGLKRPISAFFQGSAMKNIPPPLNPSSHVRRFRGSAQKVVLRSAVTIADIRNDSTASKKDVSSARSNQVAVTHDSKSTLTLAALERHTIIAGTRKMVGSRPSSTDAGTDANSAKIQNKTELSKSKAFGYRPGDPIPIEKALEIAFVPSALSRAPGRSSHISYIDKPTTGRARTGSTSSDERLSSSLTGVVVDPSDRLCDSRGAIAWTPYGIGIVDDYREKDDMVLVSLRWGAKSYIGRLFVIQLTDPSETLSYSATFTESNDTSEAIPLLDSADKEGVTSPATESTADMKDTTNKTEKRPSLFPSWIPFLGGRSKDTNSRPVANLKISEEIEADAWKSTSKSVAHTDLENLEVFTLFGPAKIRNVVLLHRVDPLGSVIEPNSISVEVIFTTWTLAHGKCARGFLSPASIHARSPLTNDEGVLAPIGEEVGMEECLLLLTLHPTFHRFVTQYCK